MRRGMATPGSIRSIATVSPCMATPAPTMPPGPPCSPPNPPTIAAALSQASFIHVRDGRRPIPHNRFNEAFMMLTSTSPQYTIIASLDVATR